MDANAKASMEPHGQSPWSSALADKCQIMPRERVKSREVTLRFSVFDIEFFPESIYNDYRFLNEFISGWKVRWPRWNGIVLKLKTIEGP
jgi:hypothetical protein